MIPRFCSMQYLYGCIYISAEILKIYIYYLMSFHVQTIHDYMSERGTLIFGISIKTRSEILPKV